MAEAVFERDFFDRVIDRTGTHSEKWDAAGDNRLPLWVADMDFASPPTVTAALVDRAAHGVFGYTRVDVQADVGAFCDWWRIRHGLSVCPGQTVLIPGVVTGMRHAVLALTEPGESVVIQPPVYGPFFDCITRSGRVVVENRLIHTADGWRMDLAHLEGCFRAGSRLLLLCSPHNPVGRVWRRGELEALLSLCQQYDVKIFSDEIHADFTYAGHPFTPMLALAGAEERVLSGCAASKTFNIAGLQQAMLVIPDAALRAKLSAGLLAAGVVSGNPFALAATRAAYQTGAPWLDGLLAYLEEARRIVYDTVKRDMPGVTCDLPEGTYLALLNTTGLGLAHEAVRERLNRPGGVLLSDGLHFGEAGRGYFRLNFGCPHAVLREGLGRVAQCLF